MIVRFVMITCLLASGCPRRMAAERPNCDTSAAGTWIAVSTGFARIEVPSGWGIDIQDDPNVPTKRGFSLFPEKGVAIVIYGLNADGLDDGSMDEWIKWFSETQYPAMTEGHSNVITLDGGRAHCGTASAVKGDRITAACVFWSHDKQSFIPIAYLVAVPPDRFQAIGGLQTLSRIAASARGFSEGMSTTPRKLP